MLPETIKGKLYTDVMKKFGMEQKVYERERITFFYQLIFPLFDNKKHNGIHSDERIPYYLNAQKFYNLYY